MTYGVPEDGYATPEMHSDTVPRATLGESAYARGRRELLALLADLHGTGIQHDLHLPQIAVVGSQSVGKSSLIEAISGVQLPRDTGTCTRCPMEVRLEHDQKEPWSCTISLRIHSSSGQQRDVSFGDVLTHPDDVEQRLRRAQRAVLRPDLNPKLFLDDSDRAFEGSNSQAPLAFTDNCVCIHIRGPGVTDLHFYDLPGVIVNVQEDQDPMDIDLVQAMVKNYVSREGCIVLLVVSCETDFENQSAGRLVRELDPSGQNTVGQSRIATIPQQFVHLIQHLGVLTKPDRCDSDSAVEWQRMADKHALESGWFVVKLPDAMERIRGGDASGAASLKFFQTNAQWKHYAAKNAARVGVPSLAEHLADRLSEQLLQDLPRIHEAIDSVLAATNDALASLPASICEDPTAEVLLRVTSFASDVARRIDGNSDVVNQISSDGLVQRLRVVYGEFKNAIWRTVPVFDARGEEARIKTEEGSGNGEGDEVVQLQDFGPEGEEAVVVVERERVIGVEEVMKTANEARTRELPGNCPFVVKKHFIAQAVAKWAAPTDACFAAAGRILLNEIDILIEERFGMYGHSGLLALVRSAVHAHLQSCANEASAALRLELRKETRGAFTQNERHLFNYKDIMLAHYKRLALPLPSPLASHQPATNPTAAPQRPAPDLSSSMPQPSITTNDTQCPDVTRSATFQNPILAVPGPSSLEKAAAIAALRQLGGAYANVIEADLTRIVSPQLEDNGRNVALDIMAEVRAYFQVAYKRFIDAIPLTIDAALIRAIDDDGGLTTALVQSLKLFGPDAKERCEKWVAEPPAVAQRRRELEGQKRALGEAKVLLAEFSRRA